VSDRAFSGPAWHTALFYAAFYMAIGVHLPFWPLWLADWGLTAGEIGGYVALGMAARVVAGLALPSLADRLDARRATVAALAMVGAGIVVGHLGVGSRPWLLALTLALGAAMAGIGPIGEALGLAAARVHGFAYARARAVGSAGFLAANLAVGALLPVTGTGLALWWIAACLVAVALLARRHPGGRRVVGARPPRMAEIGRVLVHPVFGLFLVAVALMQAGHAVLYAYGSVHWRALGLGEATIGALWAAGVAAEIAFLATVGPAWLLRLGPVRALVISGMAGVVRWAAMMLDPVGPALWGLQGLHALTFAIGHLGAMAFLAQAIPARFGAAAQGAVAATAGGLALALVMALAALAYPRFGGATYGIGAVLALAGTLVALRLGRRWGGEGLVV
jgi:MFS transporter, PPP family, 3-phenylpropionic acid transporter